MTSNVSLLLIILIKFLILDFVLESQVFIDRACICEKEKIPSDCAEAPADLSILCSHTSYNATPVRYYLYAL